MRIFKNRGDIFFSKTNKEKSTEQKILLSALAIIVVFTVVFVSLVGVKYSFSAKEFFRPEGLQVVEDTQEDNDYQLPQVSGKHNFAVFVSKENNLLFGYIMQVDLDNSSYKLSSFKADTIVEKSQLSSVFSKSGADNCVRAVEGLYDTSIDYYISMTTEQYTRLFDSFGSITYPMASEIRYRSSRLGEPINIKLKAGEQTLKGSTVINLVRYYLDIEGNTSGANDVLLSVISQQLNSKNRDKKQALFNEIVTNSHTNLTIREYSAAADEIAVLTDDRSGIRVYNAPLEYDKNKVTTTSLRNAKGYFVK